MPGTSAWTQTWYRISGEDGEDGENGNRGPQGNTGPQGPQGEQGIQGQPGDSFFASAPTLSEDGTHYIFTLADEDSDPIIVPAYQPLRILTEAEYETGTASDNSTVIVPLGSATTFYLQMNDGTDYANIVATATPLGDDAVLTRSTGEWGAALQRADDSGDITVTITAPATIGKALLDVSLIRTDGSKLTASRVLEAVTRVYGGENLTGAGTYIMQGSYSQGITISGQGITLVLEEANITAANTNAISITDGANPTLRVVGENSVSANGDAPSLFAGIYVASGSSITFTGDGTDNVLRVTTQHGAGIGSSESTPCGDITICGITVKAIGAYGGGASSPGIGSAHGSCGTITITDATVYARGHGTSFSAAPAIGSLSTLSNIVIRNSEIHAYRGYYFRELNPDYIGLGVVGMSAQGSGLIQGDIKSSTVYKYTYDYGTNTSTEDGIVVYDDQGVGTEQPRP